MTEESLQLLKFPAKICWRVRLACQAHTWLVALRGNLTPKACRSTAALLDRF